MNNPVRVIYPPKAVVHPYRLELVTGAVPKTHWCKDLDVKEPANVWWLKGGGLSRPATDIEIDLWLQLLEVQTQV